MGYRNERDLIVIYDEVHKFSDSQTKKILELKPIGIIGSSDTPRINPKIAKYVKIFEEKKFKLVTQVPVDLVITEELIAETVELQCYQQEEEHILNKVFEAYESKRKKLKKIGKNEKPKVAYVCNTNYLSKSYNRDDPNTPFELRKAPSISIWRYLTGEKGVDPNDIAVRLDIEESKKEKYRLHPDFKKHLFSRSIQNTFETFLKRDYSHIIFNKSLGTEWDDPYIYDVYIDKTMNSDTEIEQVIGRTIRQPNSKYYKDSSLNFPTIHVKVDNERMFKKIVEELRDKLQKSEATNIRIKDVINKVEKDIVPPNGDYFSPTLALDHSSTYTLIDKIVDEIPDYSQYTPDKCIGKGKIMSYKY